jgi:hypothetical protein
VRGQQHVFLVWHVATCVCTLNTSCTISCSSVKRVHVEVNAQAAAVVDLDQHATRKARGDRPTWRPAHLPLRTAALLLREAGVDGEARLGHQVVHSAHITRAPSLRRLEWHRLSSARQGRRLFLPQKTGIEQQCQSVTDATAGLRRRLASLKASAAACIFSTWRSSSSRVGPTSDLALKSVNSWLGRSLSWVGRGGMQKSVCVHVCVYCVCGGGGRVIAILPVRKSQRCAGKSSAAFCRTATRTGGVSHPELLLLPGQGAQEPDVAHPQPLIQHKPPHACGEQRVGGAGCGVSTHIPKGRRTAGNPPPPSPMVAWISPLRLKSPEMLVMLPEAGSSSSNFSGRKEALHGQLAFAFEDVVSRINTRSAPTSSSHRLYTLRVCSFTARTTGRCLNCSLGPRGR